MPPGRWTRVRPPGAGRRPGRRLGRGLGILALLLLPARLAAYEPRLADMIVSNDRQDIILHARLAGAFTPDLRQAVASGVPLQIDFEVAAYRERTMWPDKLVARPVFRNLLRFDLLTRGYTVTRSGSGVGDHRGTADPLTAENWVCALEGVPVLPLSSLWPGRDYRLEVRVTVSSPDEVSARNILFFYSAGGSWVSPTFPSQRFGIRSRRVEQP